MRHLFTLLGTHNKIIDSAIIDSVARKFDEILSLLKIQQEEITDLKKEVIIQRDWHCVYQLGNIPFFERWLP